MIPGNTLSRMLKALEGTRQLKDFAGLIDWNESVNYQVGDIHSIVTNREILYSQLEEGMLIELAHPNMVANYNGPESPPFSYCLKNNKIEFLKCYIKTQYDVYKTPLDVSMIKKDIKSFIEDAYNDFKKVSLIDLKNEKDVLAFYEKITDLIDFIEPYVSSKESIKEIVATKKAQSLYLINAGPKATLPEYMLVYALDNIDISHMVSEMLPIIQTSYDLTRHYLWGDSDTNNADKYKRWIANVELVAKSLTIDDNTQYYILRDLGQGCPVLFNVVGERDYHIKDKIYSASEIKNIYAIAMMVSTTTEYTKRVSQYRELGIELPTMESWKPTVFPDINFSDFPGLGDIDDIAMEKIKLEMQISKNIKTNKKLKI